MARKPWFDPHAGELLFAQYAERMDSFQEALADGLVTVEEVRAQHDRVVALLRVVEPLIDDVVHEKLTEALFEMAVLYGLQSIHLAQEHIES